MKFLSLSAWMITTSIILFIVAFESTGGNFRSPAMPFAGLLASAAFCGLPIWLIAFSIVAFRRKAGLGMLLWLQAFGLVALVAVCVAGSTMLH